MLYERLEIWFQVFRTRFSNYCLARFLELGFVITVSLCFGNAIQVQSLVLNHLTILHRTCNDNLICSVEQFSSNRYCTVRQNVSKEIVTVSEERTSSLTVYKERQNSVLYLDSLVLIKLKNLKSDLLLQTSKPLTETDKGHTTRQYFRLPFGLSSGQLISFGYGGSGKSVVPHSCAAMVTRAMKGPKNNKNV